LRIVATVIKHCAVIKMSIDKDVHIFLKGLVSILDLQNEAHKNRIDPTEGMSKRLQDSIDKYTQYFEGNPISVGAGHFYTVYENNEAMIMRGPYSDSWLLQPGSNKIAYSQGKSLPLGLYYQVVEKLRKQQVYGEVLSATATKEQLRYRVNLYRIFHTVVSTSELPDKDDRLVKLNAHIIDLLNEISPPVKKEPSRLESITSALPGIIKTVASNLPGMLNDSGFDLSMLEGFGGLSGTNEDGTAKEGGSMMPNAETMKGLMETISKVMQGDRLTQIKNEVQQDMSANCNSPMDAVNIISTHVKKTLKEFPELSALVNRVVPQGPGLEPPTIENGDDTVEGEIDNGEDTVDMFTSHITAGDTTVDTAKVTVTKAASYEAASDVE
jgi:hypothetical protein